MPQLTEVRFQPPPPEPDGNPKSRFQSLLWWIAGVNPARARVPVARARSFNPCCGGLQASTVEREPDRLGRAGFNPCCGGLQASTPAARADRRWAGTGFQSLLWWIAGVNTWCTRRSPTGRVVSILVVVDCRRQPVLAGAVGPVVVGFNPCCGGLQASTQKAFRELPNRLAFQSLLWWIAGVNSAPASKSQGRTCFNPCCGGLQASTRSPPHRSVKDDPVSILVVVDCRRQQ